MYDKFSLNHDLKMESREGVILHTKFKIFCMGTLWKIEDCEGGLPYVYVNLAMKSYVHSPMNGHATVLYWTLR